MTAPRPVLAWVGAAALALLASFSAGRWTAAEPEVTQEARDTNTVTTITKTAAAKAKTLVVVKDHWIYPDGSEHEHEESTEASTETTTTNGSMVEAGSSSSTTKVSSLRPDWRVGLMLGTTISLTPTPVFGLSADRRILGPFSVGLWLTQTGTVGPALAGGLSISGQF